MFACQIWLYGFVEFNNNIFGSFISWFGEYVGDWWEEYNRRRSVTVGRGKYGRPREYVLDKMNCVREERPSGWN